MAVDEDTVVGCRMPTMPTAGSADLFWVPHPNLGYCVGRLLQRKQSSPATTTPQRVRERSDDALPKRGNKGENAAVAGQNAETAVVGIDIDGSVHEVPFIAIHPCLDYQPNGVPDLLSLGDFSMAALLDSVRTRYTRDEIYSSIGHHILVSVNPYKWISYYYDDSTKQRYKEDSLLVRREVQTRQNSELKEDRQLAATPHIYRMAQDAFDRLFMSKQDQSIIISGESGAGKTEAARKIVEYLTEMEDLWAMIGGRVAANRQTCRPTNPAKSMDKQIVESTWILEAFGNAQTIRNDNSSRFGKFVNIFFNLASLRVMGAEIRSYLLERCRVVRQQQGERTFHVLALLTLHLSILPASVRDELGLANVTEFKYIQWNESQPDDLERFQKLLDALDILEFEEDEILFIWRVLATVLLLGELQFVGNAANESDLEPEIIEPISRLLSIPAAEELSRSLRFRRINQPDGEAVLVARSLKDASVARDSLAEEMYSRLFDWLVKRVNRSTLVESEEDRSTGDVKTSPGSVASAFSNAAIGLLDIYGFEVFPTNSFEQLCINYANEKLQQHFNRHIFREEQRLYDQEQIDWQKIPFEDNLDTVELLEGKRTGILPLLDSECLMPGGTDENLFLKMTKSHNYGNLLNVSRNSLEARWCFVVKHYAGEVQYDIRGFVAKNNAQLHRDIEATISCSACPFIREMFQPVELSGRAGFAKSVSMTFREQLAELMEKLERTRPSYIRCIKPNSTKATTTFQSIDCLKQMQSAGMLESVRIRQAGYSVRLELRQFVKHYRPLMVLVQNRRYSDNLPLHSPIISPVRLKSSMRARKQSAEVTRGCSIMQFPKAENASYDELRVWIADMLDSIPQNNTNQCSSWQIGITKVFLKHEFHLELESRLHKFCTRAAVKIQKNVRGMLVRTSYRYVRKMIVKIQATAKMILAQNRYETLKMKHRAAVWIQAAWKGRQVRLLFQRYRLATITIQKAFKQWKRKIYGSEDVAKAFILRATSIVEPTYEPPELVEEACVSSTVEKERFHGTGSNWAVPRKTTDSRNQTIVLGPSQRRTSSPPRHRAATIWEEPKRDFWMKKNRRKPHDKHGRRVDKRSAFEDSFQDGSSSTSSSSSYRRPRKHSKKRGLGSEILTIIETSRRQTEQVSSQLEITRRELRQLKEAKRAIEDDKQKLEMDFANLCTVLEEYKAAVAEKAEECNRLRLELEQMNEACRNLAHELDVMSSEQEHYAEALETIENHRKERDVLQENLQKTEREKIGVMNLYADLKEKCNKAYQTRSWNILNNAVRETPTLSSSTQEYLPPLTWRICPHQQKTTSEALRCSSYNESTSLSYMSSPRQPPHLDGTLIRRQIMEESPMTSRRKSIEKYQMLPKHLGESRKSTTFSSQVSFSTQQLDQQSQALYAVTPRSTVPSFNDHVNVDGKCYNDVEGSSPEIPLTSRNPRERQYACFDGRSQLRDLNRNPTRQRC